MDALVLEEVVALQTAHLEQNKQINIKGQFVSRENGAVGRKAVIRILSALSIEWFELKGRLSYEKHPYIGE